MTSITVDSGDATLVCELHERTGPLCICAHGFPDCARSFREQIGALSEAGLRVVVPSMRGYAPSSVARSGRYHVEALARDLLAIADALAPDEPVSLVGHDWGALAAYAAAALAPDRVKSLVTMAVPHLRVAGPRFLSPKQLRRSWYMLFFQLRGLSDRRLIADDGAFIDRLWRDWSPAYSPPEDEMRSVKRAVLGHPQAVLGYYRELMQRDPRAPWRRLLLSRTRVPALYLHGADDGCVGAELVRDLERAYTAGVEVHVVKDAGHFLHLEQPDVVNRLLVEFLTRAVVP